MKKGVRKSAGEYRDLKKKKEEVTRDYIIHTNCYKIQLKNFFKGNWFKEVCIETTILQALKILTCFKSDLPSDFMRTVIYSYESDILTLFNYFTPTINLKLQVGNSLQTDDHHSEQTLEF